MPWKGQWFQNRRKEGVSEGAQVLESTIITGSFAERIQVRMCALEETLHIPSGCEVEYPWLMQGVTIFPVHVVIKLRCCNLYGGLVHAFGSWPGHLHSVARYYNPCLWCVLLCLTYLNDKMDVLLVFFVIGLSEALKHLSTVNHTRTVPTVH
jgi:hypothetical protein